MITVVLIGVVGYFAFIYYVTFSKGYRSGKLIKFSIIGILVKTWEREISQGIPVDHIFKFSVQDNEQEFIDKMKDLALHSVKVTNRK